MLLMCRFLPNDSSFQVHLSLVFPHFLPTLHPGSFTEKSTVSGQWCMCSNGQFLYIVLLLFFIMDFSFKLGGKEQLAPQFGHVESATLGLRPKECASVSPLWYCWTSMLHFCSVACQHVLGMTQDKRDSVSPVVF